MFKPWINLAMLAAESQQVIFLRTLKLANGGAAAKREASRMVSEKMWAASHEFGRLMMGATSDSVVKRYRKKVKANVQRLTR